MRLCGHDCVVGDRYDPGSAGSGRCFNRLDPQNPLNFGIILSNLLLRGGGAESPLAPSRSSQSCIAMPQTPWPAADLGCPNQSQSVGPEENMKRTGHRPNPSYFVPTARPPLVSRHVFLDT